ncbi:MAG TPA: metallophosphoesterase family protein [Gemmataceae bacterium]|nr:metallophosphoesterase family protein [Gemmataceae bacterium]
MRIGILADVHEHIPRLQAALERCQRENVDRLVLLGDVFDVGRRLTETVALLAQAGVVGVWGNHELGLCHEPDEHIRRTYAGPVLDYMATLRPRLEVEDCLFTHGLPCWDPTDPAMYYLGERPESAAARANCFEAVPHRVLFLGHFHRWLAATPHACLDWDGTKPLLLPRDERYLVEIAAVADGWCAVYDTVECRLEPQRLADGSIRQPPQPKTTP